MSFFTLKMLHNSVLYDSATTPCLTKIWLFSYVLSCSVNQVAVLTNSFQRYWWSKNPLQRILWSSIFLEGISWYFRYLAWTLSLKEGNIWDYHFWLGDARFVSCPIRFQDSLIINISGRDSVISWIFCMEIIIKER